MEAGQEFFLSVRAYDKTIPLALWENCSRKDPWSLIPAYGCALTTMNAYLAKKKSDGRLFFFKCSWLEGERERNRMLPSRFSSFCFLEWNLYNILDQIKGTLSSQIILFLSIKTLLISDENQKISSVVSKGFYYFFKYHNTQLFIPIHDYLWSVQLILYPVWILWAVKPEEYFLGLVFKSICFLTCCNFSCNEHSSG